MNAHDRRSLKERLKWIADWSEPDVDLADAGTAMEALDRIEALEAENARLRIGMEAIKTVYDDQTVDIDDALSVVGKIATAALKDTRHA